MNKEELKNLREKNLLTQKKFAWMLELTPVTISNWERGATQIPFRSIRKIKKLIENGELTK